MISTRNKCPFTPNQWQELEHQALIFKYMVSGVPIPPQLIYCVKTSFDSSLAPDLPPQQHTGWDCYQVDYGRKQSQCQSQGGAGEQMGRNGGAQKKLTQIPSTVRGTCIEAGTVQESPWKLMPPPHHQHQQAQPIQHLSHQSIVTFPFQALLHSLFLPWLRKPTPISTLFFFPILPQDFLVQAYQFHVSISWILQLELTTGIMEQGKELMKDLSSLRLQGV